MAVRAPAQLGHDHATALARRSPRLVGALLLGFGIALIGLNAALIHFLSMYFPVVLVFAFAFASVGAWITITGRTNTADASNTPRWWKIGAVVVTLAGCAVGIYVAELLKN